ncbi:hypothetical protein CRG98_043827, partial [Punica granatum]
MAGPNAAPYSAISKPAKAASSATSCLRGTSLVTWAFVLVLCALSYLLGSSQHGGGRLSPIDVSAAGGQPCSGSVDSIALDFNHTHRLDDVALPFPNEVVRSYPPCGAEYSEYTPCEDAKRSQRFDQHRLIYRERHCPEKNETLKCRVPAPYGYRNPFAWPASREIAWYANVPHKELTVEKAVQNWIQFEGDRFRFPGGGTMFPNGADAYIDNIGKLIDLKSGSIRTAIDTGCGVASWGAYLLSRNILTLSFAPRDTHEAQVQFALERGVPALIGVLASKRLPYPSRAFDMAHCSRCLIPWDQFDGAYLIEVDRVLRPGGYWILSGPPINWKKHWKGWERTEDDLNAEQNRIEKVAKSLCWTKLIEKEDIAIWQKPKSHINCKLNRKLTQSPPFCPAQDSDKAWYTNMETCLTTLPEVTTSEEVAGGELQKWPERLHAIPPRISRGTVPGITAE